MPTHPLVTNAVQGIPPGTPISFDYEHMEVYIGDDIAVDVRTLLHDACAVDLVNKHRFADGTTVTLPQRKGKYAHVTRTKQAHGFSYVAWSDPRTRSPSSYITSPSAGYTAAFLARERRKRKNASQEEEEVTFTHEVTREERDAIGRARAVELE